MNFEISKDLTLVLFRANGAPKTYRFRIGSIRFFLFWLSILLLGLIFFALLISGMYYNLHKAHKSQPKLTPEVAEKLEDYEFLQKKVFELQAKAQGRTKSDFQLDAEKVPILNLLAKKTEFTNTKSPRVLIKNAQPIIRKKNNRVFVSFELHNNTPNQAPVRGFIVVLAKNRNSLHVYPNGAFNEADNILLDFRKGETFKIARFRQVEAGFIDFSTNLANASFQIILFDFNGDVLNSTNVKGST